MIPLQYTITVRLFNRILKKYHTLTNTFNAIIEDPTNPLYQVKHVYILDYVREEYDNLLAFYNMTDNDINISSYKVTSDILEARLYFEETSVKHTPILMCEFFKENAFNFSYNTFDEGIIYSWDNIVTLKGISYNGIIVEVFDVAADKVLYTSPTTNNYYVEKSSNKNISVERKLRAYDRYKNFLTESDTFQVFLPDYNTSALTPLNQKYERTPIGIYSNKVDSKLPVFKSGVGYGNDLRVEKNYEDYTNIDYNLIIKLLGNYDQPYSVFDKVSFYYKSQCTYKEDYQVIDGKVFFEGSGYQYGNIKVRAYKYDSETLKISYKLTAKLTYFTNEPSSTTKYWRTVDIVVPQEFTHDIRDYLYYEGNEVKVKETLWYGVVDPNNNKAVKDIIMSGIGNTYNIGNTMYYIYDYDIKDIKVYNVNAQDYGSGHNLPLDVAFQYTGNTINVNLPVRYYNRGLNIFEGETFFDAEVDNQSHDILAGKSYTFPMYNRYNNNMSLSTNNLKLSIYDKDSFVTATINESLKQCIAKSDITFNVPSFGIDIDENKPGYLFDFNSYLPQISNNNAKYNLTIKVSGYKGPVKEHGTEKTLNTIMDFTQLRFVGDRYCAKLSVEGVPVLKAKTITLYEPTKDYILGVVNGNATTFKYDPYGKKNLEVKFMPFLIPEKAYDMQYSIIQKDTIPGAATVTSSISGTDAPDEYAFTCLFSSNYRSDVTMNAYDELHTYTYAEKLTSLETISNKYVIDKPALEGTYNSFSVAVDTDNPEANVKEFSKDINFIDNKANVFTITVPQKHPASPWNVKIRNGYYYANQHEYFMYSKAEPTGPSTIINGEPWFDIVDNKVQLYPLPQQYAPIIVYTEEAGNLTRIETTEEDNITIKDKFTLEENQTQVYLSHLNIDTDTVKVYADGVIIEGWVLQYNYIKLPVLESNANIEVTYNVINSFSISSGDTPNSCVITMHTETPVSKARIFYETNMTDNYINADVSINPVHNLQKSGFVYLDFNDYPISKLNLQSVSTIRANNKDMATIYATVKDKYGNPIEGKTVSFVVNYGAGTLTIVNEVTDYNGIAIAKYVTPAVTDNIIYASVGTVSNTINIKSY